MQLLLQLGPDSNLVACLMVLLVLSVIAATVYVFTHNKRNKVLKAENERLKNQYEQGIS